MKKLRRILFVMMAMGLFFGMAPMTARAEHSSVYAGGVWLEFNTYYKTDANGHVTQDGASATDYNVFITENDVQRILTLNNATINGVVGKYDGVGFMGVGDKPLEIKLQGENRVSSVADEGRNSFALQHEGEVLTISGTEADKLTVISDTYDSRTDKEVSSQGIYAWGNLNIQGGNIEVYAGKGEEVNGIYVVDDFIVNDGNITVTAGNATKYWSHGIYARGETVKITGGLISVTGGDSDYNSSYGIRTDNNMEIIGGTVIATGKNCAAGHDASGLYVSGDLKVENAEIVANGGTGSTSYGLFAFGDFTVTKSKITASAQEVTGYGSFGINVNSGGGVIGNMVVTESTIIATAKGAANQSAGIMVDAGLTMTDSNISATAGNADRTWGIYTGDELTIKDSVVNAAAGDGKASLGICADDYLTITQTEGKTTDITAQGGNALDGSSYGIGSTSGSIAISGGTIKAYAMSSNDDPTSYYPPYLGGYSYGIGAGNDIIISDGTITAYAYTTESDEAYINSFGIGASNNITISGGNITAGGGKATTGKSYGIKADGTFSLKDANVESVGNTSALSGTGGFANNNSETYRLFVGTSISDATEWDAQNDVSGYVYAKNTDEFYTVTFSAGEGSGTMAAVALLKGGTLTLPECGFSAPGNKEFAGWKIGTVTYDAGDTYAVNGATTVTAQWRGIACTITYDANGGSGAMQNGIAYAGEEFTLPACGFTAAEGMKFKAWSIAGNEYAADETYTFNTDTVVAAVWEKMKYTVTYKADGQVVDTVEVEHGADVAAGDIPEIPGKTGYDQVAPVWDDDGSNVTADRTINAVYTINKYTVTYMADGKVVDTVEVEHGADVAAGDIPEIPGKTGYDQVAPVWDDDGSNVTADRTINAVYTINKYTVTYKADGTTVKTVTVEHGSNVATTDVPAVPTKTGYDQTAPTWDNDGSNVTSDRTINAVYSANVYAVTYDANGGNGIMAAASATADVAFTLPACDFTAPENHKFKCWSIAGSEYAEGATFIFTADTVVKAVWIEEDKYTVIYDANGGSGSMDSAEVFVGGTYTLSDCLFIAPKNQQFKAWQIGNDLYAEGAQITIRGDVTIKALWEDITYVVAYDANGGSGSMSDAIAVKEKEFTLPTCKFMAPEGMQFKAWNIDGTEFEEGAKVLFAANATVKAVWEEIPFEYMMVSIVPSVFKGTGTVVATANGDFDKFINVLVDNNEIRKDVDYTAVSGSTVVTLQEDYLKTLNAGQHVVTIVYADGEVSGYFAVEEVATPTPEPTATPKPSATPAPTQRPTDTPTQKPTDTPTQRPTDTPTQKPTDTPTQKPTDTPAQKPTDTPAPTTAPTTAPTAVPTETPARTHTSPKTGVEDMSMVLAVVIMLVAASGMVVCAKKKK